MKQLTLIRISPNQNCYSSSSEIRLHSFDNQSIKKIKQYTTQYKMGLEISEIQGEIYQVINIIVAPKSSIRSTNDYNQEKINNIASDIINLGDFKFDYPEFYQDWIKQYCLKYDIIRTKERIDAEYVIYKYYPKKHTTKEYVGGFSLETFFNEYLMSYVESGLVFGYIGHSCRKIWVDKLLEEICLKYIKGDDFACWLTSTNGRHFGDSIEHLVESNDKEGVEKIIKEQISFIHDKAVIYNHPEHKGTYASTVELFEKLKDMNMMMGDDMRWI